MTTSHSRRGVLSAAGKLAVLGAAATVAGCDGVGSSKSASEKPADTEAELVAFHGLHQAGIATPVQERLIYGTFDLLDDDRGTLRTLLQSWTVAAAALTAAKPVGPVAPVSDRPQVAPTRSRAVRASSMA